MNRYAVQGVLGDMRRGKRVLVLCESVLHAQEAFRLVHAHLDGEERAIRTSGKEECRSENGEGVVTFRSVRAGHGNGLRGMSYDGGVLRHAHVDR